MKEDEINLAAARTTQKIPNVFLTPSFFIFIFVFVIAILILSYVFILKINLSSLQFNSRRLQAQIATFEQKKDKILIVSERLASARKILASRNHLDSVVQSILSVVPDNFSIESVQANNKEISLSISGDPLSGFVSFLSEGIPTLTQNKTLAISKVSADSFTQSKNGYLLSLTFSLAGQQK